MVEIRYYVNRHPQDNGDHEVHKEDCQFLPDKENRVDLGLFYDCEQAVEKAKKDYPQADGCWFCAERCHTS